MLRLSIAVATALLAGCGPGSDPVGPPVNLDIRIDMASGDVDPDSRNARMCVDDDGGVFVVWIDNRDGTDDIWFNRSLDFGVSWMPSAIKLNSEPDSLVWNPAIACNDAGVYVVWEDDRDGDLQNHNIYFNRSLDGGETWAPRDVLLELDEQGHSFSQGPQITTSGDQVYVTWYDNLNGAADILCVASDDNGTQWSAPARVDSDEPAGGNFSGSPKIAASGVNVYITWEDTRNGASDVYFARSDNGGRSFRSDVRLDGGDEAGSAYSFSPTVAADGDDVYVVWHDARNGDGRDVYLNYSANAGADWFSAAERVDTDRAGFFDSLFPKVEVVGSKGYVGWSDNRTDETYDVYVRVFDAGVAEGPEQRVDTGHDIGAANSTDVVMSTNGVEVLIGYEDQRNGDVTDVGYNDLFYNYLVGDSPQTSDLRIDTFYAANSFKTDLSVHLHQQLVYAVWIDGREGTADVFFKSLALGDEGETLEEEPTAPDPVR